MVINVILTMNAQMGHNVFLAVVNARLVSQESSVKSNLRSMEKFVVLDNVEQVYVILPQNYVIVQLAGLETFVSSKRMDGPVTGITIVTVTMAMVFVINYQDIVYAKVRGRVSPARLIQQSMVYHV